MTTVADQLLAARDLIADKERWCQGCHGRDAEGRVLFNEQIDRAVAYCAEAAAVLVQGSNALIGPVGYLSRAAEDLYDRWLWDVNDDLGHEAVMAVYDEAIRLAKDEGA